MKKISQKLQLIFVVTLMVYSSSCKKNYDNVQVPETPLLTNTGNVNPADSAGTLKSLTANIFTNIGMAVNYGNMSSNSAYVALAKTQVNNVTFENELKEGSVVRNDGTYNYSTADALYTLANANGLTVYGHTLVWHSQQNATYLNSLIAPTVSAPVITNLLLNGGFEDGTGSTFTNWSAYNGATSFSAGSGTNEVRTGSRSLKVVVAADGQAYAVQLASALIPTTVGTSYTMIFYVKSATAGGKMRISTGPTAQYSADYTTSATFAPYTFTFVAKDTQTRLLIDIGYLANTYYLDDVSFSGPAVGSGSVEQTPAQKAAAVEKEMKNYITATMQHYTGKIKAWDVVNEAFLNNGAIRTNTNYTISAANVGSEFLYAQYIGGKYDDNNYILKAFQYAKVADPTSLRFINDYNLETSKAKVDSIVALVNFVNKKGALVDGIGTQMHIAINTPHSGIDYAFKTMAATGLKVRISELDVILNLNKTATYTPSPSALSLQADMYKYVMQSYVKNVPAPQRFGVTIWGVSDKESWLNTAAIPDVPLLFDKNYKKKVAFVGFIQGLK